jgi:hypothetical protein
MCQNKGHANIVANKGVFYFFTVHDSFLYRSIVANTLAYNWIAGVSLSTAGWADWPEGSREWPQYGQKGFCIFLWVPINTLWSLTTTSRFSANDPVFYQFTQFSLSWNLLSIHRPMLVVQWHYWVTFFKQTKLRGLSLWANYTDQVTTACRRS